MRKTNLAHQHSFASPLESVLALKVADYVHPMEVVQDGRLNVADKRAILSAWASDACAVDSRPGFRWLSGTPGPILVDHVLRALRALDGMEGLMLRGAKAPALKVGQSGLGSSFDQTAYYCSG